MRHRFVVAYLWFEVRGPLMVGASIATPPEVVRRRRDAGGGSDVEVLTIARDSEGRPTLPASGLAGALRSLAARAQIPEAALFGFVREAQQQPQGYRGDDSGADQTEGPEGRRTATAASAPAALDIDDGLVVVADHDVRRVTQRTRTVVDRRTGSSAAGLLFTAEELDLADDDRIRLRLELAVPDPPAGAELRREFGRLLDALRRYGLVVGGGVRSGHGRLVVAGDHPWSEPERWIREVDLTEPERLKAWLLADPTPESVGAPDPRDLTGTALSPDDPVLAQISEEPVAPGRVARGLRFELGLTPIEPYLSTDRPQTGDDQPGNALTAVAVSGRPGLPATAVRGALRTRAERIARTAGSPVWPVAHLPGERGQPGGADPVSGAFGHTTHAGMVSVDDAEASDATDATFTFVAIDRFTGGARADHLFTVTANAGGSLALGIEVELDHGGVDAWRSAVGQVLLVLLDVATADLPLGGLTRRGFGTFRGTRLSVSPIGAVAPDLVPEVIGGEWKPEAVIEPWERPRRSMFLPPPGDPRRAFLDGCVLAFHRDASREGGLQP